MRIFFYAPFKPLDHPVPSGDLVIATGMADFLRSRGHEIVVPSRLRTRWLHLKPREWPRAAAEAARVARLMSGAPPDLWLTYHSYYKAPDVLGPLFARSVPYVIFQGSYATAKARRLSTLPGFLANRAALLRARRVFVNRKEDGRNLVRLLPASRVGYVPPGIAPADFRFDPEARERLRAQWGAGETPVVLSAAMFRPGVKAAGLALTIRACGALLRAGVDLKLVIAGDGAERDALSALARAETGGRAIFLGRVERLDLYRVYSAADVFAFPGMDESLGMVYLEAQSCGLPVAAFADGGVPEVVASGLTGILTPARAFGPFRDAVARLVLDPALRRTMGRAAAKRVRTFHDREKNYLDLEEQLLEIVKKIAHT